MRVLLVVFGLIVLVLVGFSGHAALGDEPVFSGPQIGEVLANFEARHATGESAGENFDLVAKADGKPLLIIFVHKVTRPSIGLTRTVMNYATNQKNKGLTSGIVFLTADATETESWLKRIRNSPALPKNVPRGISMDGEEGPGAYGLNRKMTLTVLVGNENKVTANFPLVQPSINADAPRIAEAIAKVLGRDEQPTLADLGIPQRGGRMQLDDGRFRAMLGPVINKTATPDEVDAAARKVEELAAKNSAFKTRVAEVTNRIIGAGRLDGYGTERAQTYLKKWAKDFRGGENRSKPNKTE